MSRLFVNVFFRLGGDHGAPPRGPVIGCLDDLTHEVASGTLRKCTDPVGLRPFWKAERQGAGAGGTKSLRWGGSTQRTEEQAILQCKAFLRGEL